MKWTTCLLLGLCLLIEGYGVAEQEPTADATRKASRVEKHIYKMTPQGELAITVHFPDGWSAKDRRTAIVFFFGGGWRGGRIEQFLPQAEYFASRGMVTARADYRVLSRHGTKPDKCVEDAKSAVRWLRKNAAKLGIDPDKIVASGGSAGGHIAACAYTTKGLEAEGEDLSVSSKPNLLVLYNPVLDCTFIARRLDSLETAKLISPNLHLTKDVPPTLLLYGTKDRLFAQGKEFVTRSKKVGNVVELYTAEGAGHGFFNRPPWLERTTYRVDQFLAKHGYLKGKPTVQPTPAPKQKDL